MQLIVRCCILAGDDTMWIISAEDRAKHNAQFEQLKPVDGFVTGINVFVENSVFFSVLIILEFELFQLLAVLLQYLSVVCNFARVICRCRLCCQCTLQCTCHCCWHRT